MRDRTPDGELSDRGHAGIPAPFWRRLAAMFYDALIVIALLMLGTAVVLPLNAGEAFEPSNVLLQLYLLALVLGFFLLFWRKGGQTLGMRAWKIKLISDGEKVPTYGQLLIRAITGGIGTAVVGIGVLWSLIDRDRLAVHDRLSKTRLIFMDPSRRPG